MSQLLRFSCDKTIPEKIIDEQLALFLGSSDDYRFLLIDYAMVQYWLPDAAEKQLYAIICCRRLNSAAEITYTVSASEPDTAGLLAAQHDFLNWCDAKQLPVFSTSKAALLETVAIKKPWGQEIWYTGIEQRGVAALQSINGLACPLPWALSLMPRRSCSNHGADLILLKILDPLPDQVTGDLYFELHQEKREVYVVTAVDKEAWPDGVGEIKFGFNRAKLAGYASQNAFKADFLDSVKSYEVVRRNIDDYFDEQCLAQQLSPLEPVDPKQQREWAAQLPASLLKRELELRNYMDSFVGVLKLKVGDVVKVPCFTPHALQHGVRTVEFQTPVYERLIVSFAQKVLTQDHWDTDRAADIMTLATPVAEVFDCRQQAGCLIEKIVDFEDFEVYRYKLAAKASVSIDANKYSYALIMSIIGDLALAGLPLKAEQAALIPNAIADLIIYNPDDAEMCFLIAYPK